MSVIGSLFQQGERRRDFMFLSLFIQTLIWQYSTSNPIEHNEIAANLVMPQEVCQLTIPTAVTINSENKYWQISCDCPIKEFEIDLYDRWGKKVYNSKTLQNSKYILWNFWDFKKETYYWTINYSVLRNGELVKLSQQGHVTIL
jgi:hypothetical protein